MNVTDEVHRDFGPDDDYPHPVPPQAFQIWRENWVFPSVDPVNKVACLFHFSLRPGQGEGIFTAKFAIDGWEHRYVGRSPVPRDLSTFRPVKNEKITFTEAEFAENNDWIKRYLRKEMYVTAFSADEARRITVETDPMVLKAVDSLPKAKALLESANRVIVQRLR